MFYAHFVLSKKGPLAKIWLAAHWDKKLTKAQVFETSIEGSVEAIIQPKIKLALRTSGHLLLGVVRIYSRKTKYLLSDCNEAFVRIKMAFRPGLSDLLEESNTAAIAAITLPETFPEYEAEIPDFPDFLCMDPAEATLFTGHQSQPQDITLRDEPHDVNIFQQEDNFEFDDAFDFERVFRDIVKTSKGLLEQKSVEANNNVLDDPIPASMINNVLDDPVPLSVTNNIIENPFTVSTTPAHGIDDVMSPGALRLDTTEDMLRESIPNLDMDASFYPDMPSVAESVESVDTTLPLPTIQDYLPLHTEDTTRDIPTSFLMRPFNETEKTLHQELELDKTLNAETDVTHPSIRSYAANATREQTTLISNEDEEFALEPVDVTTRSIKKAKRRRKLIIDEPRTMPSRVIIAQISNTADIVTTFDMAPPNKDLMLWKATGSTDKMFNMPAGKLYCSKLTKLFTANLITETDKKTKERARERQSSVLADKSKQSVTEVNLSVNETTRVTRRSSRLNSTRLTHPALEQDQLDDGHSDLQLENLRVSGKIPDVGDVTMMRDVSGLDNVTMMGDVSGVDNMTMRGDLPAVDSVTIGDDFPAVDSVLSLATEYEDLPSLIQLDIEIQEPSESSDAFEERLLQSRSQQLLSTIKLRSQNQDPVVFQHLLRGRSKKQAASAFYTLLVLAKSKAVSVQQSQPFGVISVSLYS